MANAISTRASSNCRSSSVISRKSAASPNFQPAASRAFRLSASILHSSFILFGESGNRGGESGSFRVEPEETAACVAYAAGPTQRRGGLALGGVFTRVTGLDCIIGQEQQATPQRTQAWVMRTELIQEPI